MSIPISSSKLRIPRGFQGLLEGMTREVLHMQPRDIYAFAAVYFEKLLKSRDEPAEEYDDSDLEPAEDGQRQQQRQSGDPADIVRRSEDRYYNDEAFKRPAVTESKLESEKAALAIQTKYRQFQAKSNVDDMRKQNAAVKIQSAARGYLARCKVRRLRTELGARDGDAVIESDEDEELKDLTFHDEDEMLPEVEPLADNKVNDDHHSPQQPISKVVTASEPPAPTKVETPEKKPPEEEEVDIDLSDPEVKKAAVFIQAGFKGFKARKSGFAKPPVVTAAAAEPKPVKDPEGKLNLENEEVNHAVETIQAGIRTAMVLLDAVQDAKQGEPKDEASETEERSSVRDETAAEEPEPTLDDASDQDQDRKPAVENETGDDEDMDPDPNNLVDFLHEEERGTENDKDAEAENLGAKTEDGEEAATERSRESDIAADALAELFE